MCIKKKKKNYTALHLWLQSRLKRFFTAFTYLFIFCKPPSQPEMIKKIKINKINTSRLCLI